MIQRQLYQRQILHKWALLHLLLMMYRILLLKNLLIQQHKESAAHMLLLQLHMLPQEIIFTAGIIPILPLPLRIFASQTPTRFIRVSRVYETAALILTGVRIL